MQQQQHKQQQPHQINEKGINEKCTINTQLSYILFLTEYAIYDKFSFYLLTNGN